MLQFLQKNRREKVEFVDISLEGYDEAKYGGISYERAMEEMHVIDENDQVGCYLLHHFFFKFAVCPGNVGCCNIHHAKLYYYKQYSRGRSAPVGFTVFVLRR